MNSKSLGKGKHNIKCFVIGFICFFFFGCTTSPVRFENSRLALESQILNSPPMTAKSVEDGAKVIIIRDSGVARSTVKEKVFIDGIPVVELWPGQRFEVFLQAGALIFGVIPSPNLLGTYGMSETKVMLRMGETAYLRIYTDASMTTRIHRSVILN
jgi:hypothetical protein